MPALHFDHLTLVVRDLDRAREVFGILGFREEKAVVISGPEMARYMGVPDIVADHVTLVLHGVLPRQEIQLLRYRAPAPAADPAASDLTRTGWNHVCFRVDDLDTTVRALVAAGVRLRNQVMTFHERRLVFFEGPEGVTLELSEAAPLGPDGRRAPAVSG